MDDPYPPEVPTLLDELLDDQRRRWQEGERVLVEAYLDRQPDLRASTESLVALVRSEIRLRAQAGEHPEDRGMSDLPQDVVPPESGVEVGLGREKEDQRHQRQRGRRAAGRADGEIQGGGAE